MRCAESIRSRVWFIGLSCRPKKDRDYNGKSFPRSPPLSSGPCRSCRKSEYCIVALLGGMFGKCYSLRPFWPLPMADACPRIGRRRLQGRPVFKEFR
ncbi:hypothetical protein MDS_0964 [Ectopseudomonas mendocina NK-01]|nr:hypothetical protein MDS_0964 [Pseudomonas mendocina NK-01]